jgi:hypothetical protein
MAPADWGGAKDTEEVGSRSLADSENGPLMAPADWGGAKETEEVRAENGHLMAPADWGGAEEVEEAKESRPLASIPLAIGTLLVILGSATGYLVWAGGCQRVVSATIYLTSPGLAAVHGSAHSPVWVSAGGCRRTVSATIYFSSPGLAAVRGQARARSLTPPHPSPTVSATQLLHSSLHLCRGILQASLVLLQEPRAQS